MIFNVKDDDDDDDDDDNNDNDDDDEVVAQFGKYLKEIWWKLEEKIWLRCHFNAEKMALFDFNLDSDEKSDSLLLLV